MPQMRIAATAGDRIALHPQAIVAALARCSNGNRLPKARPPVRESNLVFESYNTVVAAHAAVNSIGVLGRTLRKRRPQFRLARNAGCERRQLRTPFSVGLDDLSTRTTRPLPAGEKFSIDTSLLCSGPDKVAAELLSIKEMADSAVNPATKKRRLAVSLMTYPHTTALFYP